MSDHPIPSAPLVVSAWRESPREPGRVKLTLSDGREFRLTLGALVDLGLTRIGLPVDSTLLARIEREHAIGACVHRALASLARSRRTRRELERRLQRFEHDATIVTAALDRMAEQGLISDEQVADAEAASRLRRGMGPGAVRQVLHRKGVPRALIDQALVTVTQEAEYDERAACNQLALKRMRSLSSLAPDVARRRLTAFLLRRGFAGAIVRDVVSKMLRAERHP